MSDSLIQHLRVNAFGPCCEEAADRIEALEAECQELIKLRLADNEHKRKLEEALREIAKRDERTSGVPARLLERSILEMTAIARRALEGKP